MAADKQYTVGSRFISQFADAIDWQRSFRVTGNARMRRDSKSVTIHVGRQSQDVPDAPAQLRRVKVVEANVSLDADISLCSVATGDGEYSEDTMPVATLGRKATNDEFYAAKIAGGMVGDLTYEDDGEDVPVLWREMPAFGSAVRFKVTTAPSAGSTSVLAKWFNGSGVSGDEVKIKAIQGHSLNDILYAEPVENGTDVTDAEWIELLTPAISTDKYKVIQVIDTQGKLGLDWVRSHG